MMTAAFGGPICAGHSGCSAWAGPRGTIVVGLISCCHLLRLPALVLGTTCDCGLCRRQGTLNVLLCSLLNSRL